MQMVICYLPNIAARFPYTKSLLDFGAGPTIHVAIIFRNKVDEVKLFCNIHIRGVLYILYAIFYFVQYPEISKIVEIC